MANSFGVEEINRYLDLVSRRLYILMHPLDWKPEYSQELEEIDKEIAVLRGMMDSVRSNLKGGS